MQQCLCVIVTDFTITIINFTMRFYKLYLGFGEIRRIYYIKSQLLGLLSLT